MRIYKSKIILIPLVCTILGCSLPKEDKNLPSDTSSLTNPAPKATPKVIGDLERSLLAAGLVDIQELDSTILVDLKYSSTDNFVGVDVYGALERCYLQRDVAIQLVRAQAELSIRKPGYRLLVYDGARPLSVQQILWDTLAKPEDLKPLYVADPKIGSIHNYGSAVDLTIADDKGQPLDMGTGYDFFGELAYPSKEEEFLQTGLLTHEQVNNRKLLREVMSLAGFTPINTEWWHFNAYSREKASQLFSIIQ